MWKLVIEDDEGRRTIVPLTRDDYTIGRKDGNTIRLTERNVSRDHAKIRKKNGVAGDAQPAPTLPSAPSPYDLEDLSSYNGIYVNGHRVAETHELVHGDLIQIGDYRIVVQDDSVIEDIPFPVIGSVITDDLRQPTPTGPGIPAALRATHAAFLEKPNRLVMLAGPTPGEEYPLTDDRLTIGRAEDATISVNHNSVSRLHCEVHALGEGRFEIVDKGSSNGVRVNGADLRRGIIEAGDIIELGDVRFKFVGQGQAFRPGASDSEQLAAISNRSASMIEARGRGSLLPAVLLGTLVAAGLVAGYAYVGRRRSIGATSAAVATNAAPPENPDDVSLVEAKRLYDAGDYEAAHQKAAQITEGSSLRGSADFRFIEYGWANMLLTRADGESDPASKRGPLERVAGASSVDANLRKTANDRLALLDQPAAMALVALDAGKSAIAPAAHSGPMRASPLSAPGSPLLALPNPPPRSVQKPSPPAVSFDTERTLALSSNASDVQRARDLLEPRVFGGRASPDEVRLLEAICKQQRDPQCTRQCKQFESGGGI
jgi:pSer/pThr/pTyr-binding forkhead associated (FHA) protein